MHRRSVLLPVERISALLLRFPGLVAGFERKTPQAMLDLVRWLEDAEEALRAFGMVEASELAGIRSRLLRPAYSDDDARSSLRRRQHAAAVALLEDAQRCVHKALAPRAATADQARALASSLMQVVAQSGAITYDPALGLQVLVRQVWSLCCQHEQLRPHTAQIKALIPPEEREILLAEVIEPVDFIQGGGGQP